MNISGLLGISRSGLNHLQTNLDTTANNIANVNTNGYQAQTTHFQALMENAIGAEETLFNGNTAQYGASMGAKATTTTSFAQGNLAGTAQPLDLAIQGNGFFGVRDQTGQLLLSRAGNFHLSENKQLVNSEGYPCGNDHKRTDPSVAGCAANRNRCQRSVDDGRKWSDSSVGTADPLSADEYRKHHASGQPTVQCR